MLRLLGILALLAVSASSLSAQVKSKAAPLRQGFAGAVGAASSSVDIDCDGCERTATGGVAGFLRVGAHVNPQLFLGVEGVASTHDENELYEDVTYLLGVVQWYPTRTSNLFVKGSLGFASYTGDDLSDVIEISAPAFGIGLGYDLGAIRGLALTPYVNYLATTEGPVKFNGTELDFKASTSLLQVGLALTWF